MPMVLSSDYFEITIIIEPEIHSKTEESSLNFLRRYDIFRWHYIVYEYLIQTYQWNACTTYAFNLKNKQKRQFSLLDDF